MLAAQALTAVRALGRDQPAVRVPGQAPPVVRELDPDQLAALELAPPVAQAVGEPAPALEQAVGEPVPALEQAQQAAQAQAQQAAPERVESVRA